MKKALNLCAELASKLQNVCIKGKLRKMGQNIFERMMMKNSPLT